MFPLVWYAKLNRDVLTQQVQDMATIAPPAVAWISIKDRGDSPNLLTWPYPKGFVSDLVGGFDTYVTTCQSLSEELILANHYCNCSEMFSEVLQAPLANHVGGIQYRDFQPAPFISLNTTNSSLVLQIFSDRKRFRLSHSPFNADGLADNTSVTPRDWMMPGPFLELMVYDPSIPMLEAFTSGQAPVRHIPVLGSSTVTVTPEYRIGWGRDPYYYYSQSLTCVIETVS
jgi:hypothetical protein